MASSTTLSLKSVRVAHPLYHHCFLACIRHGYACMHIPPAYTCIMLRMHCTTVCDPAHMSDVSPSMRRIILCKNCNIMSMRRTLDISSKNGCCICNLYSSECGSLSKTQHSHWPLVSLLYTMYVSRMASLFLFISTVKNLLVYS